MKRYTFKTDNGVYIGRAYPKNKISFGGIQKLGQIEDIEEEIDMSIPTLFKAITHEDNMGRTYFKWKGKWWVIKEMIEK